MAKGGEFLLPEDSLNMDIYTPNDRTEEHLMLGQTMREFMEREVVPNTQDFEEKTGDFSPYRAILKKFAELGILGAEIPEEYGGQGMDKISGTIIAEAIAGYGHGSLACTFLAHTGIGTLPILFFGTEEQKKKYLPRLVSGEWVGAYSLTEVGAGSDANAVKAKAVRTEDGVHFILNGEKKFVTSGGFADVYIVFAQLEGIGLTAFIVEASFSGVQRGKEEHKMGIVGTSTIDLVLKDAVVPVENLLGDPGKGFKIAVNVLNLGRFKLGAACSGAGSFALNQAFKYSKERKQFKQPIINFGVIRYKLAQMMAKVYAMEAIVYRTAGHIEEAISQVDTKDPKAVLKAIEEFAVECSIVKVSCSEALDFNVDENVQIHGGMGFCEGNAERQYRDSRINRIFEGTNEINILLVPGMILDRAFKDEIPLIAAAKKLQDEILSPSPSLGQKPEDLVGELFGVLTNSKKAVLLASAIAVEKWRAEAKGDPTKLKEIMSLHQIPLYFMGKCMINIYVMESVLVRLVRNRLEVCEAMVQLIFNDMVPEIEKWTREIMIMSLEGDTQRTYLAALKRFMKFTPFNLEQLCNDAVTKGA